MGLWMSFLVRRHEAGGGLLSPLLAGLALARAIEGVAGVHADLKWPNDVLIGGRKVAGVLCESAGSQVVVGIGLNVRQRETDFPSELRGRALSVEMAAGKPVARAALAAAVLEQARRLLDRPVLRLDDELLAEIRRRDVLRGRRVRVEGLFGRALGVDARGRLLVEVAPDEARPVHSGHVELIEPEITSEGAG
jgi:BirA family biotin operon repressor/biotin-[acetyl-CoA-carboxylase] ligase